VNGTDVGSGTSEVGLNAGQLVRIQVKAAAMLSEFPDPKFVNLRYDQQPYWDVERERIPGTREVPVEVIVNGLPVARKTVVAARKIRELEFRSPHPQE